MLPFSETLTGAALAALAGAVSKELAGNTATGSGMNYELGIRNYESQLSELQDQFSIFNSPASAKATVGRQFSILSSSGRNLHAAALNLSSGR